MTNPFSYMHTTVLFILVICWLVFAFAFLFRERTAAPMKGRSRLAMIGGIMLQILAFALVSGIRRPEEVNDTPLSLQIAIAIFTIALAFGSIWIVIAAVRTLSRHFAEDPKADSEQFITEGVFCMVRYPLNTGLLGMLIATGLTMSYANVLVLSVLVFLLGFFIRVRTDEKELQKTFGEQFIKYARSVPAIFPRPASGK